jgi:hypothetical protein
MRTIMHTIWRSFSTPLAQLVLLVTLFVGLLTIIEKIKNMIVGTYREFIAFRSSRVAKRVLSFMKRTHPTSYYKTDEIALGLKLTIRKTWDALERLEGEEKVNRISVDQAIGGSLWALDELER